MRQLAFPHAEFADRLNAFMKAIKATGKRMAEVAGVSKQSFSGYRSGSVPSAPVLLAWANKLDLNINWLLTGQGKMFRNGEENRSVSGSATLTPLTIGRMPTVRAIPVIGLATCSMEGWFNPGPMAMKLSMPVDYRPQADLFAVMAIGTSMQPAGIRHGHVLICDPSAQPVSYDNVYIEQNDGKATVKRFLGMDEEWIYLTGWLPPHPETGIQKQFQEQRRLAELAKIACVVVIQLKA